MRFLLVLLLTAAAAHGATWNSPTTAWTDVTNTAASLAAGDTLQLPSGTNTWPNTTLTFNVPVILAGTSSNTTVITISRDNSGGNGAGAGINFQGYGYNQIHDLQLIGQGGSKGFPLVNCWSGQAFRAYNCVFKDGRQALHVGGPFGVIDHCAFENCLNDLQVYGNGVGQSNWDSYYPIPYSSTNYLFMENCSSRKGSALQTLFGGSASAIHCSAGQGSSYVVRYNTLLADGTASLGQFVEWHGDNNDGTRGSLSAQVYGNTVTLTGSASLGVFVAARGGQGLVYSNTVTTPTSGYGYFIEEWEEYPSGTFVNGVKVYDYVTNQWQWNNKFIVAGVTNSMVAGCSGNPSSAPGGCSMLDFHNAAYGGSFTQPYPHPLVSSAPPVFGQLRMFGTAASLVENQVSATMYVRRTNGTDGAVGVTARTADQTATAPLYYASVTTNLTWAAGVDGYQTFEVPLVNIPTNGTHTFLVYLTNATGGATLTSPTSTVVSIIGTASASTQVVYFASPASSAGASGPLTNNVVRTNGSTGTVTVDYATHDGTALAGRDYVSTNGTLTFGPGVTNLPITVAITWQSQPTNRTATISLSNVTGGAALVDPGTNTVTILAGPSLYTVSVAATGLVQSVTVTNTPADNQGATSGTTPYALIYTGLGTNSVSLTAPAVVALTNNFTQWLVDNLFSTTNRTVVVTNNASHTATAVYVPTPPPPTADITVTSTPSGVTVNNAPEDINGSLGGNTPFTLTFNSGETVTYSANEFVASGALTFSKWQTNGVDAATTLSLVEQALDATVIKAVYGATPAFTLTVQSTNPVANVFISTFPAATNSAAFGTTPFTLPYYTNTTVSLTAPALASTNVFQGWLLDNATFTPQQTATLLMNGNHVMRAVYGSRPSNIQLHNATIINATVAP